MPDSSLLPSMMFTWGDVSTADTSEAGAREHPMVSVAGLTRAGGEGGPRGKRLLLRNNIGLRPRSTDETWIFTAFASMAA
jgi:hypothetical protein